MNIDNDDIKKGKQMKGRWYIPVEVDITNKNRYLDEQWTTF